MYDEEKEQYNKDFLESVRETWQIALPEKSTSKTPMGSVQPFQLTARNRELTGKTSQRSGEKLNET